MSRLHARPANRLYGMKTKFLCMVLKMKITNGLWWSVLEGKDRQMLSMHVGFAEYDGSCTCMYESITFYISPKCFLLRLANEWEFLNSFDLVGLYKKRTLETRGFHVYVAGRSMC